MEIDKILEERGVSHGNFEDNATLTYFMFEQIKNKIDCITLNLEDKAVLHEGIHMILHKISRAVSGDVRFKDHWEDIVGYATLIKNKLNREEKNNVKSN